MKKDLISMDDLTLQEVKDYLVRAKKSGRNAAR